MKDLIEVHLKSEIDEIAGRINTIMKKIDELAPEKKEEPQIEDPVETSEEEKDISKEPS